MKTNSFKTGLSDHHHMIYTILKTKFEKFEPKKLIYRNFKQFDSEQFKLNICKSKNLIEIVKFKQQRNLVTNLNKQAKLQHLDKKSVDCNSKPF